MDEVLCELTVFFEEPFWVGVFERFDNGNLSVAKVTFGAEPKDYEIYDFILKNYYNLQFSPAVSTVVTRTKMNPKRMQRDVKKQLHNIRIGTKSQQALKLQQEQSKLLRKERRKEQNEANSKRKFELKQQKKRNKHRGR